MHNPIVITHYQMRINTVDNYQQKNVKSVVKTMLAPVLTTFASVEMLKKHRVLSNIPHRFSQKSTLLTVNKKLFNTISTAV